MSKKAVAAAVVATLLTPVLMPGLPVLVAAIVALVVGGFNLFGNRPVPPVLPESRGATSADRQAAQRPDSDGGGIA